MEKNWRLGVLGSEVSSAVSKCIQVHLGAYSDSRYRCKVSLRGHRLCKLHRVKLECAFFQNQVYLS